MSKRKTKLKITMDGSELFKDGAYIEQSWADGVNGRLASLQIVNELCKLPNYEWLLDILQNTPKEKLPAEYV